MNAIGSLARALVIAMQCATVFSCTPASPKSPAVSSTTETAKPITNPTPSAPLTLSVLGINDLHGKLEALPLFSGYANNVRQARDRDGGGVVLVDAGDMFQGTLESNLSEGASVVRAYNVLGMHAAALGNHEFDFGPPGVPPDEPGEDPQGALKARLAEASFPVLSANLVDERGKLPAWQNLKPSALRTIAGVRVGFIGALTERTPNIVTRAYFAGLNVTPLAAAIEREAKVLRASGADVVLVLAHEGAECHEFSNPTDLSSCSEHKIFEVARALPPKSVDAIIGGHTHSGVAHMVNGIPIVEAYSKGRAFSRVDLRIDPELKRVLDVQIFPPHPLCRTGSCEAEGMYEDRPVVADALTSAAIADALAQAKKRRNESLNVVLADELPAIGSQESALGNLFVDLMREALPGSDVAISNGGSLRAALPKGELLYGALYEAMPFDNFLAKVELTGAELRQVISHHLQAPNSNIISVSGLFVTAECTNGKLTVTLRRPSGTRVRDDDKLILATSDYLATGGDGLLEPASLPESRIKTDTNTFVREAFAALLRKRKSISEGALLDNKRPRMKVPGSKPVSCRSE